MAYQPDRFDEVPEYTDQRGAHRESFAAAGATAAGGGRRLSPLLWVAGLVLLAGLFVGVVLPWLTGDRSEPVAAESSTTAPAVEPSPSPSTSSESSSASSASASTASATESATPSEDAAEASRSAAAAESSRAAQEAAAKSTEELTCGWGVPQSDTGMRQHQVQWTADQRFELRAGQRRGGVDERREVHVVPLISRAGRRRRR